MSGQTRVPREGRSLRDDDARAILDRAIQLETLSTRGTTVDELREVAREIGIAPDVFERAVQQIDAARRAGETHRPAAAPVAPVAPAEPRPEPRGWRRWINVATVGLTGAGLAAITAFPLRWVRGPDDDWVRLSSGGTVPFEPMCLGLAFLALLLARHHRRYGSQLDFQFNLMSLAVGFSLGAWVLQPRVQDDVLAVILAGWMMFSVVGGLLVSLFRGRRGS